MQNKKFRNFSELPTINLGCKSFDDVNIGEEIIISKSDSLYLNDTGLWIDQQHIINNKAISIEASVVMSKNKNGSSVIKLIPAKKQDLVYRMQYLNAFKTHNDVADHIQDSYAHVQLKLAELKATRAKFDKKTYRKYTRKYNMRGDLLAVFSYTLINGATICDN